MNIFASFACPVMSAKVLDDKRVVKMVLETAQLLSNKLGGPYRRTHTNHPCSLWVSEHPSNEEWLWRHFWALCDEYHDRYGKHHKCSTLWKRPDQQQDLLLPERFANCTPHKDMEVHAAYRKTLTEKWSKDKRPPTWHRKSTPPLPWKTLEDSE